MYGARYSSFLGSSFAILDLVLVTSLIITAKRIESTRCHICMFHLAHCTNPLDCYNQPDTCSNTNFSPLHSQVVDCEFGCEQYVITDATGSIVLWRRGCATEGSPKSSYICFSRNIFFMRHEQCWCHTDQCNSSLKLQFSLLLQYFSVTIVLITLLYVSPVYRL